MKRKVLVTLLVLSMVVALMGCGNGSKENDGGNSAEGTEAKTTAATSSEDGAEAGDGAMSTDWRDKYDETVTITTALKDSGIPLFPEGDNMTSNVWTRAFKERLNVNVVTDWITEDTQYDTKLNLAITSGELPDTYVVSLTQLKQLIEAGMVMDISDIYDTYASDGLKAHMNADMDTFNTAKVDGALYAIPRMHFGNIEQIDQLWLRKDWMEAQNLEAPETVADMENVMQSMMDNGAKSGLTIESNLYGLQVLAPSFHAYYGTWVEDDNGKVAYGSVQPAMKEALRTWADWYDKGYINQDFAATDWSGMMAKVVSGEVGVMPWFQWWGYSPGPDVVTNFGPEAIFEPYFLPSIDGKPVKQAVNFANTEYIVVNKNAKNPEAIMKLLSFSVYINKEAVGIEPEEVLAEFIDGSRHLGAGTFIVRDVLGDYNQVTNIKEALAANDPSKLTTSAARQKYSVILDFLENKTPSSVGDYMQQGHEKSAYGIGKEVLDNGDFFLSKLWGESPEELLQYGSTLDDLLLEGFTKIIMGIEPVDHFDEVVTQWKAAGGDSVTEAMNAMYGK